MRARTLIFALVCGTASAAMAQNSGYVRFISPSPDACAVACSGDQMCASWSYGAGSGARSYGQSQASADGGMCTFSSSSSPRATPGMISGLPRRGVEQSAVPWVAGPSQPSPAAQQMPQQSRQNYTPATARGPVSQAPTSNRGASGWDVRPAPWLSHSNGANAPAAPYSQAPQYQNVPPLPSTTPYNAPRIEYEPQTQPAQPNYSNRSSGPTILVPPAQPQFQPQPQYRPAPAYPPPVYQQPAYTPPAYTPPPVQSAPVMIAPPPRRQAAPMVQPPPPPQTQEMPDAGSTTPAIALPTRPRAARGVPRPKAASAVAVSPPVAPQAPAAIASQQPPPAAPPRQETAARPTTGRNAPRAPVQTV
jgi:hypothetical protein